jgi:hypothetical protein
MGWDKGQKGLSLSLYKTSALFIELELGGDNVVGVNKRKHKGTNTAKKSTLFSANLTKLSAKVLFCYFRTPLFVFQNFDPKPKY